MDTYNGYKNKDTWHAMLYINNDELLYNDILNMSDVDILNMSDVDMLNISDCLVLKLEEFERNTDNIDNTIYILYDTNKETYIVRGSRNGLVNDHMDFSYECKNVDSLMIFVRYAIGKYNRVNESLYNFPEMYVDSNNITFDYLCERSRDCEEISGYMITRIKKSRLKKMLAMLRDIGNYY